MPTALITAFMILAVMSPALSHAAVVFTENFNDGTIDPAITGSVPLAVDTGPAPLGERFLGLNDGPNNTDPSNRGLSNAAVNLTVISASHTQGTLSFSLYLIATLDGNETFQVAEGTLGPLFQLHCNNLNPGASCPPPSNVSPAVSGLTVAKVGDNVLGFTDTNSGAVDDSVFNVSLTFTQPFSVTQTQLTFAYFGLQEITDESGVSTTSSCPRMPRTVRAFRSPARSHCCRSLWWARSARHTGDAAAADDRPPGYADGAGSSAPSPLQSHHSASATVAELARNQADVNSPPLGVR